TSINDVANPMFVCFFFSSRSRHTSFSRDWSSDVCSSDLVPEPARSPGARPLPRGAGARPAAVGRPGAGWRPGGGAGGRGRVAAGGGVPRVPAGRRLPAAGPVARLLRAGGHPTRLRLRRRLCRRLRRRPAPRPRRPPGTRPGPGGGHARPGLPGHPLRPPRRLGPDRRHVPFGLRGRGRRDMSYAPGSLVTARGREWVVLPESSDALVMVRPLGGTDDEVTGILPELEPVEPATFRLPDPDDLGD